jgi:F-type H+-transporting ATPase subunit g
VSIERGEIGRWWRFSPLFFWTQNKTNRIGLGETLLYWARVGVEIVRTTASQQRMSPLDLPGQFIEAKAGLSTFLSSFVNGRWRDVTTRQALTMAGRGAEILGFFTVGTMIGKRSIAGYKHVPQ